MQHVARNTKFSRPNAALVLAVVFLSGILAYTSVARGSLTISETGITSDGNIGFRISTPSSGFSSEGKN